MFFFLRKRKIRYRKGGKEESIGQEKGKHRRDNETKERQANKTQKRWER